jgi:hypothetical protein
MSEKGQRTGATGLAKQQQRMPDRVRWRLYPPVGENTGGLLLHQLLLRLLAEMLELEADLFRRDGLAFGGEVAGDLVDDVPIATRLELGGNDIFGVSFGIGAREPQTLRRPHPQQPIAPRCSLETKFLIVFEPGFEFFFPVSKASHVL